MKEKLKNLEDGVLTNQMEVNSEEFDMFQAKLLNISRGRTADQRRNVELLALRYKIEDYLNSEGEDIKLAGEFLKQYLKALKIKQITFAKYIGLKPSNLNKLLKGERPINYNLALIFGEIFKIEPMYWVEIQAKNELSRLKREKNNEYYNYSLNDLLLEKN